jgi:hypothetical protein
VNQNSNFTLTKENLIRETGSFEFEFFPITEQGHEAVVATNENNETVELCLATPEPNLENSTITANPTAIPADGNSVSTITVQLKDADGNNLTSGGEDVQITTNNGTITPAVDNNDGTYTSILQSTSVEEIATTRFTLNGTQSIQTAPVEFYISSDCYFTSSFRTHAPADGNSGVCKIGTNNVLTVGSNGNNGVVTLFDPNGGVTWRKQINLVERNVSLSSVVTCSDGQSAIVLGSYATGATNRAHLVVFRINSQGNILWSKLLYSSNTRFGTGIKKLNENAGGQKYLITAWYNEVALQDDMELYKIDENGNMNSSRKVSGFSDEQIMEVITTPFGFTILGSATTPPEQTVRHGIVLSINDNLDLNFGKRLGDGSYLYTTGAIPTSSTSEISIVAGVHDNSNKLFLTYFNSASNSLNVKTTLVGTSTDKLSTNTKLVKGANRTFYCIVNYLNDRASEVIKFDYELNELWRRNKLNGIP